MYLLYPKKSGDRERSGPVFSYKLRYIVGFLLVEMAISTNQKPTIYRNLYENTAPGPRAPKNVHNILMTMRPVSWAFN